MSGEGKKIITVFGATGAQGGSVVRHLLKNGTFAVRGVTRKPDGPAANELRKLGVEVVQADLENKDQVKAALKGAYGAFGLTNFWEHNVWIEGEVRQGKLLGDAVKEEGVQHYVWSSLEHSEVPHAETKAQVADYLREINVPFTEIITSFYYENMKKGGYFGINKNNEGEYHIHLPMISSVKFPMFAVEDLGGWVLQFFLHPAEYIGNCVGVVTEFNSLDEVAQQFHKVTGQKLHVPSIDLKGMEEFAKQGEFQKELYLNMRYFVDHPEDTRFRDPVKTKKIYPQAQNWETFLNSHLGLYL